MTDPAEMQPPQGGEPAPAAGAEPSIPKHRFDEIASQNRALREELQLQKQMISQYMAPQQPQPRKIDLSRYGLDENMGQAVMEAAKAIVQDELAPVMQQVRAQVAHVATTAEEAQFLAEFGSDKASALDPMREIRANYARQYGTYLPLKAAYNLHRMEGIDAQASRKARAPQAPAPAGAQSTQPQGAPAAPQPQPYAPEPAYYPNPASTQGVPANGGSAQVPARSFGQMTPEEMEAQLERGFQSGATL